MKNIYLLLLLFVTTLICEAELYCPFGLTVGQPIQRTEGIALSGSNLEIRCFLSNTSKTDQIVLPWPGFTRFDWVGDVRSSLTLDSLDFSNEVWRSRGFQVYSPVKQSFSTNDIVLLKTGESYSQSIRIDFKDTEVSAPLLFFVTFIATNDGRTLGCNAWTGRVCSSTYILSVSNIVTQSSEGTVR